MLLMSHVSVLMQELFFKFGSRHELSGLSERGVNKEQRSNGNKRESKRNSAREDTNTCVSVPLESTPPPTHTRTLRHTHSDAHTCTPVKKSVVFFHSHHHRYPAEVLQRALATHKVAKSLPFCVTAGNNTYTCLADSFCRSPLCIRMKRERRSEADCGGVGVVCGGVRGIFYAGFGHFLGAAWAKTERRI